MQHAKTKIAAALAGLLSANLALAGGIDSVQSGSDINATDNPFVQPQDPALAGNGRDQTQQFGDVLLGDAGDNLQIGGLGTDVLSGDRGDDVMIGGLEHFNPSNRDRAFGGPGNDLFIWKPGDGSDLFFGGPGHDVLVFGVVGEDNGNGAEFGVVFDQVRGNVFLDPATGLPQVNVSGSPGFCEVIDETSSFDAGAQLDALDLDHLVRFSIRGVRNAFEAGDQDTDNGLRVTLHLQDVETVVCTTREGGEIEVIDLTQSPAARIPVEDITQYIQSRKLLERLDAIVF